MPKDTLIWAIQEIGGISKDRLERAGTLSEWLELPAADGRVSKRAMLGLEKKRRTGDTPLFEDKGLFA